MVKCRLKVFFFRENRLLILLSLKASSLWPHSNLLAPLKRVYLKKGCNICLLQSQSLHQWSSGVQWKGRHKSAVLSLWGWVIAPISSPYNNDLHDRPVTWLMRSLVGGLKQGCLWLKIINIPMTRWEWKWQMVRGIFFLLNAMCVFYQNPPSLKGWLKKVKWFNSGSGREKEEKV